MRARSGAIAVKFFSIICIFGPLGANGAELQPPISLRSPGVTSYPPDDGCTRLGPLGPVDPAALIVRDTPRPDVGPYKVSLPGYATNPTSTSSDVYRPYLINTAPGHTLRFDLTDAWPNNIGPGDGVNLHTHGLIVLPRPCRPYGDYIFTEASSPGDPGASSMISYRIDIPATLPGLMFSRNPQPQPFPSGLYWVHAHVHQDAKNDVMAGQASLLYVGDLERDLAQLPGVDAATAQRLSTENVKYLGPAEGPTRIPYQ